MSEVIKPIVKDEGTAEPLEIKSSEIKPASEPSEIKSSVVFICAITPNPIVEFDKVVSVKARNGSWLPALSGKVILKDGREAVAKFPVFCMDAMNEAELEDLRSTLHTRIDGVIEEHKRRYAETAKKSVRDVLKTEPKEAEDGRTPG